MMKYNDGQEKPSKEESSSKRATRQKPLTLHPPYMQTPKISRQKKRKYPKNFHQPHQAIRAKEVEHIEAGVAEPGDEARTQATDIHQYPPDNPRILTE